MKKLALTIAAAAMVGFAGSALADSDNPNSQTTGNPGNGKQNCTFGKNPGQFNQSLKELDTNPGQLAKFVDEANYGDLIEIVCGIAPS